MRPVLIEMDIQHSMHEFDAPVRIASNNVFVISTAATFVVWQSVLPLFLA
jgi:hypothetical protein